MANLVLSTPSYILRFDSKARRTFVIEEGRGEYFGISWFEGAKDIVLSHSHRRDNEARSFSDLIRSETGTLSVGQRQSQPFLSQPHQIRCVGKDMVIATNTGRNQISAVNVRDWSVRQVRIGDELWDRDEAMAPVGRHLNSVDVIGDEVYVVEHNWDRGAALSILNWPSLEVIERREIKAKGAHNVWVRESGEIFVCDTMRGSLIDAASGKAVWRSNDPQSLTRGLAATAEHIFVGASEPASAGSRAVGMTGFWVLDAETLQAVDYVCLGKFGAVHEIRVLDEPDFCHRSSGIALTPYLEGLSPEDFWTQGKLANAKRRFLDQERWDVHEASLEMLDGGWRATIGDQLTLVTRRGVTMRDVRLRFEVDMRDPKSHQMDMVWRYRGPGDTNYNAALFVRTPHGISVEACRNVDGVWTELGRTFWPATHGSVELTAVGENIAIACGDNARLEVVDHAPLPAGGVGVRALRGRMREFKHETLDVGRGRNR